MGGLPEAPGLSLAHVQHWHSPTRGDMSGDKAVRFTCTLSTFFRACRCHDVADCPDFRSHEFDLPKALGFAEQFIGLL